MPRAVMMVFNNPASTSQKDEYNQWYADVHIPDTLQVPGIVGARRYAFVPTERTGKVIQPPEDQRYLTIYEIDDDDPSEIPSRISKSLSNGSITISDLVQGDPPSTVLLFQEL